MAGRLLLNPDLSKVRLELSFAVDLAQNLPPLPAIGRPGSCGAPSCQRQVRPSESYTGVRWNVEAVANDSRQWEGCSGDPRPLSFSSYPLRIARAYGTDG